MAEHKQELRNSYPETYQTICLHQAVKEVNRQQVTEHCQNTPEPGKHFCKEHQQEETQVKTWQELTKHLNQYHVVEKGEVDMRILHHIPIFLELKGLAEIPAGIWDKGSYAVVSWIQQGILQAGPRRERGKRKAVTPLPEQLSLPNKPYSIIRDAFLLEVIPQKQLKKVPPKQLEFDFMEGKEMLKYTKQTSAQQTDYYIPKEMLDGNLPSVPLMRRAFVGSLAMALEQGTHTIRFTLGEKLRKLNYDSARLKKGGEIFGQLATAEKALVGMTFHYKNQKRGKEHIELIGHPYTNLLQSGQGRGAMYEIILNPAFTKGMSFETGKIDGRFVKIPSRYITDSSMGHHERNIRLWAQNYINMPELTVNGLTLLEATGAPESLLKRKRKRDRIYSEALQMLQQEGFKRTKWEPNRDDPTDCRKFKLTFIPPKSKTGTGKVEYKAQLNEAEEDFKKRFTEWQSRDVHYGPKGRQLTADEISEQITNTIKKYGLETCKKFYNEVQASSSPSPRLFWNKIKELKKLKV